MEDCTFLTPTVSLSSSSLSLVASPPIPLIRLSKNWSVWSSSVRSCYNLFISFFVRSPSRSFIFLGEILIFLWLSEWSLLMTSTHSRSRNLSIWACSSLRFALFSTIALRDDILKCSSYSCLYFLMTWFRFLFSSCLYWIIRLYFGCFWQEFCNSISLALSWSEKPSLHEVVVLGYARYYTN